MILWKANGSLDVATDPSDLPQQSDSQGNIQSGALARCKNLRLDLQGVAKTRDGSAKVNATALAETEIWKIIEQAGVRYAFAGTSIYRDEVSISGSYPSAAWSAVKYNPYNSSTQSIYALNGTSRKRIEGSTVYEWGIAAPTAAPLLAAGALTGLTGAYNAKYTYCRKEGTTVVSESNPSPAGAAAITLANGSLSITVTASIDTQVTHVRIYRTLANGSDYYHDRDIAVGTLTTDSNTADGAVGSAVEIDHYRPPLGTFVAGPTYNGTLFILKDNKLYFSKPKQPDYWPATYYIEVSPLQDPGQVIIFYNAQPYVLTKHRIIQIQGTGADTFFPLPLEAITGAQGPSAALGVSGQGIFHAGSDGIYLYNGVDRKISQAAFDPIFRGETAGGLPGMDDPSFSWVFQFKNRLYIGYRSAGYIYPSNVLVFNLDTQRTSYFTWEIQIRTLCHDEYNDRLLAGDAAGYIWHLEKSSATDDAGTAIAWEAQSKDFGTQTRSQFPAGVKYDVNASLATGAKGEVLLDGAVHQTHLLSDNRSTKKRLIAGGNGKRLSLRLSGSGAVSIYAAEILT